VQVLLPAALEEGLREPGGNRVAEEREIYALRERLQCYPQAVTAKDGESIRCAV
jgi:hypothetical protein